METQLRDRYLAGVSSRHGIYLVGWFLCDRWDRSGRRSDGARFTVASLGRYHLHDVEHHLYDVGS